MTDEEYKKLVSVYLKLKMAESKLAETVDELQKANEVLRELVLKKQ